MWLHVPGPAGFVLSIVAVIALVSDVECYPAGRQRVDEVLAVAWIIVGMASVIWILWSRRDGPDFSEPDHLSTLARLATNYHADRCVHGGAIFPSPSPGAGH